MFYTHLFWFIFLFVLFSFSILASLFVTLSKITCLISFNIFSSWFFTFDFSVTIDWISLWFMTCVLLISSIISIYSFFYMSPYYKSSVFLWFTFLFILSMLLVISLSNLFYSMLGWDGLGVVSFFLIVFYQNSSSITSGLFTLLINRLGDGLFLVTLSLMALHLPDFYSISRSLSDSTYLYFFMAATFMTKSAIYPFSSWLPLAMSAPTPISALVHSSTLVTSGLYLMMRFSYLLYSCSTLIVILMSVSLFTSFYAGVNTFFEPDLKKLIALSTLSHLGFIGLSFSCGLLTLAFFHLLAHALFKSLLFMCIGDIIINLGHSQDIRFLSSGVHYTPFSVFFIYVSLLNLLGMPNISGFFSKDLILESLHYSNLSSFFVIVVYFNVLLTYFYTFQLFFYSFSSNKSTPLFIFHSQSFIHSFLMAVLGVVSVIFGKLFIDIISFSCFFFVVPRSLKLLPISINVAIFLYLCLFISFPKPLFLISSYVFSNMLGLTPFLISTASSVYYSHCFHIVKSLEIGLPNHYLHVTFINSLSSLLLSLFSLYRFQPFYSVLFCFSILILLSNLYITL